MLTSLKTLTACILVGIVVALIYLGFEHAVSFSTVYVWNDVFNSDTVRWMVLPLSILLALLFFGVQQLLDPGSQNKEAHSLGGKPIEPTVKNFLIILLLGYLSLLAGASLGPEAVLVPASVLAGSYIGIKLFKKERQLAQVLAGAAMMALMAAFFHSFFIGVLSVLLVASQLKTKVTLKLLLVAVIASASSYFTLQLLDPANRYLNLPTITWQVAIVDALMVILLVMLGYVSTFGLKYAHVGIKKVRSAIKLDNWWKLGLFAGLGLGIIYLVGGPLIEFTGNHAIEPLASQASALGILGLIGILIIKIIAIAWSRAMGYRGGLIFPMIFVASALVIILMQVFPQANFGIGLIAALVGIFAAEKKAKILL